MAPPPRTDPPMPRSPLARRPRAGSAARAPPAARPPAPSPRRRQATASSGTESPRRRHRARSLRRPPPGRDGASRASAVQAVLVEVVSEKTGYPAEVLEPGMQLDADLGIDSIKRVEILAALQERLPGPR